MKKTSNLVCRALLVLLGVFLATLPTQAKVYDFENESDNTLWHFINGSQTNKWVVGTSAGSNGGGTNALYISEDGTSYSYANTTSTVWAYCDVVLTGDVTISFDYKGTGESSYDYMYAYLIPVSASQPTAGSTTVPTGTIQIGGRFNDRSSWTTFIDEERALIGQYYLYFMWHNDGSVNNKPIAIDNVNILTNGFVCDDRRFSFRNVRKSQSTISALIQYESENPHNKIGYALYNDTVWQEKGIDTIQFRANGLQYDTIHHFSLMVYDSILIDTVVLDYPSYVRIENVEYTTVNNYWGYIEHRYGFMTEYYFSLSGGEDWIFFPVKLAGGVEYRIDVATYSGSPQVSIAHAADTACIDTILVTSFSSDYNLTYTPDTTGLYYLCFYGNDNLFIQGLEMWSIPCIIEVLRTTEASFSTQPLNTSFAVAEKTQTTLSVHAEYDYGDAIISSENIIQGIEYWKENTSNSSIIPDTAMYIIPFSERDIDTVIVGLAPNTRYAIRTFIKDNDRITYSPVGVAATEDVGFSLITRDVTQTTARVSLGVDCGDVPAIEQCGFTYYKSGQSDVVDTIFFASNDPVVTLDTLLTGLSLNTEYHVTPFVDIDSVRYFCSTYSIFTTADVLVSLTCGTTTQSTVPVTFTYNYGDADELNTGINGIQYCKGNKFAENSTIYTFSIDSIAPSLSLDTLIHNLTPGEQYTFRPYVEIESVGYQYGATETVRMKSISLSASLVNRTQTTISMHFEYTLGDANVNYVQCTLGNMDFYIYPTGTSGALDTTFTQLHAGTDYALSAYARLTNNETCGNISKTFTTLPVVVNTPSVSEYGQTYVVVNSNYDYGDATLVRNVLEFKRSALDNAEIDTTVNIIGTQTKVTNLIPDTTYYYRHVLEIEKVQSSKSYDFETIQSNTHWHFINGTQTNRWVIGTSAGSNGAGSSALYVSSDGTSCSYANTTSTVWAYCDDVLSGMVTISFDWEGTGESSYDYMYAYLVPISASQPAAGSTTVPTGTIQIGSRFNGQSSWTTFTDDRRTLVGEYRLYFMWRNDDSVNNSPITIDNVNMDVQSDILGEDLFTTDWQEFNTKEITLSTQMADGISNTSALLHGTIDCDQESYTEVGFEWKRSDAPATYQPQRLLVTDRVDENLIFRLEGLSSDRYYDYRTFCSYLGQTYYGEWVAFLTAESAVVVAPTVQTVGAEITEQGVEMEGFVVAGTEPMLQQGFEVWVKGTTNVLTTVAEGTIMHAYIPELRSYTTYQYRAYAKTAAGTTYGATLEIETGYIKQNVQDVTVTPSATEATITWTVVEDAVYYLLTLFADEAQTDTIGVYEVGTDGVITRRNKPGAVQSLVNCLVEELEPDTEYFFSVIAYNAADQKVAEETGWFATELPTSLVFTTEEESSASAPIVRKILYRGQVLILRDGKAYNLLGQEVR